jgi:hypothetical protein
VVARVGEPTRCCGDTTGSGVTTSVCEIRDGDVWMPRVPVAFEARRLPWSDFFWTQVR